VQGEEFGRQFIAKDHKLIQVIESRELLINTKAGAEQCAHIDSTAPFHNISMLLHESLNTVERTVYRKTKNNYSLLSNIDLKKQKQHYTLPWKDDELHPLIYNDDLIPSGSVIQNAGND
jgi:hypothetical protein